MKKIKKTRYVGYIRVSTLKQLSSGLSVDSQIDKIKKYVELHDGKLIKIFVEQASGKKSNREKLKTIMNNLKKFDCLIVFSIDRLSRTTLDFLRLVNKLKKANKEFVSIKENMDTTSSYGKFTMTILSALSEIECELIASRVSDAKKQAFKNKKVYGKTPYGYIKDGNNLIVNSDEIKNIHMIFDMRINKNTSLTNIANYLNENNIKSKTGGKWYASSIRSAMLTYNKLNPDYEIKYNKRKRKYNVG